MASINFYNGGTVMSGQYAESAVPNLYRTQMESGYAKQVRKNSKALQNREVVYLFTNAEYIAFKNWFYDTAAHGTLFFNAADPVDNVTREFRIVNGEFTANPVSPLMSHWYVTMTWEAYR